jgi:hypothetical protein
VVVDREVRSGECGERPDRVEHGGEVVLPGPAGGHPECPLAAGASQTAGDLKQVAASGLGGLDGLVGQPDLGCPASEVVRERGDHRPRAVCLELSGGEVSEGLVFEVADHELDRGVVAMIDVGDQRRDRAVGRERMVAPVGDSSAWVPTRRVRRTTSRHAPSVVSAIWASPVSG